MIQWHTEKLDDGGIGIRIQGQDELIIVNGLPDHAKAEDVSRAMMEVVARYELKHLRETHQEALYKLNAAALEAVRATVAAKESASPPFLAEFVVSFLAPEKSAQAFLGDLQEIFHKNVDRFGEQQARRKYWLQVASSVGPLLWLWLKRIGFFTVLIDYFRSKLGF